jgi:hypothetical protein
MTLVLIVIIIIIIIIIITYRAGRQKNNVSYSQ